MENKFSIHSSHSSDNIRFTIALITINCVILFAGRSIQHLFNDIPIRIVLWDPHFMKSIVNNLLELSWEEYVSSVEWDRRIQNIVRYLGVFYFLCTIYCVLCFFMNDRRSRVILLSGAFALFALSVLYYLDKFMRIGELMEYSAQWMSPIFLFLLLNKSTSIQNVGLLMRVSVALTFTGHALYAMGIYPVPGNYVDMMIIALDISQETAMKFLWVAGLLDIVVSILILLPYTHRYAALYAFAWGGLTAFARIWVNFDPSFTSESAIQWGPEFLVRIPHALIPLAIWFFPAELHESSESFFRTKKQLHKS
jgi:hypothetical protein